MDIAKIIGLCFLSFALLLALAYWIGYFIVLIQNRRARNENKKSNLDLTNLNSLILLRALFNAGKEEREYFFVVHKNGEKILVEFLKKHHNDPGIDLDTGRRNSYSLKSIDKVSFFKTEGGGYWNIEVDGRGWSNSHKYPVECVEINGQMFSKVFSEEKKEEKREEKLADIIPFRK